ncbi:MAG: carbon starvation protein A [Anaerolineae bacterium]|nr:carbon starvation protein A [Anaerolineae bacterium]
MNTLFALVLALVVIYLGYMFYAKRVDTQVIKADPKKATPAKLYMDGVDFSPTDRNVLYGYQFKSIAAAGPIVGAITAANLWGWLPAMLWLFVGVTFIGWVQDYSAMMMAVRRDGDSITAIAHKLISPRTRTILLLFIFVYLLMILGAFGNLLAGALAANPSVPLGIVVLALAGMLAGQMLYRWKMDLIVTTIIVVGVTFLAILIGPLPEISNAIRGLNSSLNALGLTIYFVDVDGLVKPFTTSYMFWLLFVVAFSYLGATLPIWRYAQPVNYIGFWVMALTIVGGLLGAVVAVVVKPSLANFVLPAFTTFDAGRGGALQPLWPMLFVTIACGAISGWHALVSTVGTGRQLEYETDALPVGAGSMFSEMLLALLALMAISVAGKGAGAAAFASGVGQFLSIFGLDPTYGTALGFASFVIIVITVTQLALRFMRVVLAEWAGDLWPAAKNIHIGTIISAILMIIIVLSGTFTYLWQIFGASNQLMASLALMLICLWLVSEKKNPAYAFWPMVFMYVTTIAANLISAYNLWVTVVLRQAGKPELWFAVVGAVAMIIISLFLIGAALFIGYDAWQAYNRMKAGKAATAPTE